MIFGYDPNDAERILNEKGPYDKVNVEVTVQWLKTGEIIPLSFVWEDRELKIDKVLECQKGNSMKLYRSGLRYKCKAGQKIFFLYYDGEAWYIELIRF